jgi:hypothetical protein
VAIPQIDGWSYPFPLLSGNNEKPQPPTTSLLTPGSIFDVWALGGGEIDESIHQWWILNPGAHELRFRTAFSITLGSGNYQGIEVWSNAVMLTALENEYRH